MSEIKCTNLRFNLKKPLQRQAWERLQAMDRQKFKSYSQVVALAIVDYFDRLERLQDDPYLETRESEERFVNRIVAAVESGVVLDVGSSASYGYHHGRYVFYLPIGDYRFYADAYVNVQRYDPTTGGYVSVPVTLMDGVGTI